MPIAHLKYFYCNYRYEDYKHEKTILFCNSLGTDLTMWDENISYLSKYFNIVRHDMRGHGKSTIHQTECTVEEYGKDVIELLDFLHLDKVIFCGLSIGGLIGQWLGINHSDRFQTIILCNTAAKIGTSEGWNTRITQVTANGLHSILEGTADRWFMPNYRKKYPEKVKEILSVFEKNTLAGYIAGCTAVRDADFSLYLNKITIPVLVIAGSLDEVTTIKDGEFLIKNMANAQLESLTAAHLSNKEDPQIFSELILKTILNKE